MTKVAVRVDTPRGRKHHGFAYPDEKVFERNVTPADMMFKYKAWSVNPDIMKLLQEKEYKQIRFNVKPKVADPYITTISVEDAVKHGFEETNAGGATWYIPEEYWTKISA